MSPRSEKKIFVMRFSEVALLRVDAVRLLAGDGVALVEAGGLEVAAVGSVQDACQRGVARGTEVPILAAVGSYNLGISP